MNIYNSQYQHKWQFLERVSRNRQGFLGCLTDASEAGYIPGRGVYTANGTAGHQTVEKAYRIDQNL